MKVYFKDKKDLYLEVTYDDFNNYYAVKAMSFDDVLLGILNFKIIQENFYKKIWLYKIPLSYITENNNDANSQNFNKTK